MWWSRLLRGVLPWPALRRLAASRRANAAMVFAIAVTPVAFALVFGLDLSRTTRLQQTLQAASDAAALAALAPLASGDAADQDVRDVLDANLTQNLGNPDDLDVESFTLSVDTGDDGVITATVTTTASIAPMWLNGPFGPAAKVTVSSTTTTGQASYMDVHFWLDGSASMDMPSTEAGRDRLIYLSRDDYDPDHPDRMNCQFACHIETKLADSDKHYKTSYARAKANNVELRGDVMTAATKEVIDVLSEFNTPVVRVKFSIHQFSDEARMLAALTADTASLKTELDKMTAVNGPYRYTNYGPGSSRMVSTLPQMADEVPSDGTGFTPASRRQFVVLVTDGMQFNLHWLYPKIDTGPIPTDACTKLKERGVEIAVIQLRYVPQKDHWTYGAYVEDNLVPEDKLGPALKACASPDYYFRADSPQQIHDAFELLASRLMTHIRIAS